MVARNFSSPELSYTRLLQVPDEDFVPNEDVKPPVHQQSVAPHAQEYQNTYYDLSNAIIE